MVERVNEETWGTFDANLNRDVVFETFFPVSVGLRPEDLNRNFTFTFSSCLLLVAPHSSPTLRIFFVFGTQIHHLNMMLRGEIGESPDVPTLPQAFNVANLQQMPLVWASPTQRASVRVGEGP